MTILASLQNLESIRQKRQLEKLLSLGAARMELEAKQSLADLLMWCRDTVPAYGETLSKWSVDTIRENPREILSELPVLDKASIRRWGDGLISVRTPRTGIRTNSSGGSTGEPLQLLQDRKYRRWNRAATSLFESWAGFRHGQRKAILWGMPRDLATGKKPWTRLNNWLQNRHLLDAYRMSPEAMDRYAGSLRSNPPKLLRCLAQSGAELAQHILQRGKSIEGIGAVMSTGGVLHQAEREQMEKAFNAPVFNIYGSREVGPVACETHPRGPMKIIPLVHHVEILDEKDHPVSNGQSGDIVITLLTNRTMPLLRYRIGDRGRGADHQDSEQSWPALAAIEGRVMGHFVTTDGALVNGEYFTHLMFNKPWIRKFQWIQHTKKSVELKCVVNTDGLSGGQSPAFQAELEQKTREILGPEITLKLNIVEKIKPSPSGKHHYTISKVPRPAAGSHP